MSESLRAQTSRRLWQAGISADDRARAYLRSWNRAASERQIIRVELRRGQFGATRLARLDDFRSSRDNG